MAEGETGAFLARIAGLKRTGAPAFYRCEPLWRWAPPPLPDYDLWCVLDGEGEMRLAGKRHTLRPGAAFVLWPGARPRATHDPQRRLHVFACHFDLPGIAPPAPDDPDPADLPAPGYVLPDTAYLHAVARRCVAGHARGDALGEAQCGLLLRALLLHLWEASRAAPAPGPADPAIAAVAQAIREDPGREWGVAEQARRVGLSRAQYTRRFVAATGVAPARFVIETRLERAASLIRETEMSLTQIAAALGYRDLYFFSRQFKRFRGVAPSALRRRDE